MTFPKLATKCKRKLKKVKLLYKDPKYKQQVTLLMRCLWFYRHGDRSELLAQRMQEALK